MERKFFMINCAVPRRLFVKAMPQKTIASFFKRKCDDQEKENAKKVASKSDSTEVISYPIILTDADKPEFANLKVSYTVGKTWLKELEKEFSADYFKKVSDFLIRELRACTIFPPIQDIFSWTTSVAIYGVKVVILGQDPYITHGQAHGLAFSVRKGVALPKSLINIFTELAEDDKNFVRPTHGCLNGWADQGVLLLNSCLTVQEKKSNSHKGRGWEQLTDAVIEWVNENLEHVVFILWGNNAKEKSKLISENKHLILTAAHPSPLSAHRGFFGCRHFSKANNYLQKHGIQEINWKHLP